MSNEVRQSQDRRAWDRAQLAVALDEPTVTNRRKRFASGDLPQVARAAAAPTSLFTASLMLQSDQVASQLSLARVMAGPGTVD